jgi:hypothetical protein
VYSLGFPGIDAEACTSDNALNYFVQVNRYEDMLRQAFDAAGQPFPEPSTGSGGAGGAADEPAEGGSSELNGGGGQQSHEGPPPSAGGEDSGCQLSQAARSHASGLMLSMLALALAYVRRGRRWRRL